MPHRSAVVIKLGSNALVGADGRLDLAFLHAVAIQVRAVADRGLRPVLVSSGAVSCGMAALNLNARPVIISETQALAAIGQADLVHHWQAALGAYGLIAAQVLLTQDAFNDRERYLNLTATLRALFAHDVIPIVNENDTVAVEELTVGDNDRLSALLANQLGARLLLLLTDIDGYYERDPRTDPNARLVSRLDRITSAVLDAAGNAGARGRGGMRTKLEAAALASEGGVTTIIGRARADEIIIRAVDGAAVGTRIDACGTIAPSSRRRWLALARSIKGTLTIDDGAVRALTSQGRSLLPAGIVGVAGDFRRGDTVAIRDRHGHDIARGIVALAAVDLRAIAGMRMDAAAAHLGTVLPKNAVHRDDLLLKR